MDLKESWVIAWLIVVLSVYDSILTLHILTLGGIEVNPVMLSLLEIGDVVFLAGKFAVTTISVMFLYRHWDFKFLGIIKVKWLLRAILAFYITLIGYESYLIYWINTM